jgi:hypothetical protein
VQELTHDFGFVIKEPIQDGRTGMYLMLAVRHGTSFVSGVAGVVLLRLLEH